MFKAPKRSRADAPPAAPATDAAAPADTSTAPWKVLVVDDEPMVQSITRLALRDLQYLGRPLEFLLAGSLHEARCVLQAEQGVAVALVDVVMETRHAGLELVDHIRHQLHDSAMRILLRTGQPGLTPQRDVLATFDINTYLDKATTDADRLYAAVLTALRSFDEVMTLRDALDQMHARAVTDPLTGLQNASTLHATLARALASAHRRCEPLTVMFLDLDDFKLINDLHGHQRGDEVLRAVGAALLANSRAEDSCFRYGGDEFLVVLPHCTVAQLEAVVLPRLLKDIESLGMRVSYGAVEAGPHTYPGADEMIRRADERMYTCKRAQRSMRILPEKHLLRTRP